jgi:hypothetical protein
MVDRDVMPQGSVAIRSHFLPVWTTPGTYWLPRIQVQASVPAYFQVHEDFGPIVTDFVRVLQVYVHSGSADQESDVQR